MTQVTVTPPSQAQTTPSYDRNEGWELRTRYFVKTEAGFVYQLGSRKKNNVSFQHHPDIQHRIRFSSGRESIFDYIYAMMWEKESTARKMAKKFGGEVVKIEFRRDEVSRVTLH